MELNFLFFAAAIPAVLFAGISKGGFASGAAFAATPLLALILEPGAAVGLMLPLLMVMDITGLKSYWKKWDWRNARVVIIGAVPGTALGAAIFGVVEADTFRILIGLVAIGFVAYRGAHKIGLIATTKRAYNPVLGGFWGCVAGVTSFISHAGGPPYAVYMLPQKLDKTTYQATAILVFWAINWLKFFPYMFLGIFTVQTAIADLILAPVAILGTLLGVYVHRFIPEKIYLTLTYGLLLAAGSKLLFNGLTAG